MLGVKNLKVIAASLCLSATLFTGCSNDNKISFGQSVIDYENETPKGTISYEDLSNCCKIVVIENDETTSQHLLMKLVENPFVRYGENYTTFSYVDFKTGTVIIEYKNYTTSGKTSWVVGENLNIVEEQDITGYLLQEEFIKRGYEVSEVLTFYEEKIKPTLESSEKELVK